MTKGFQGRLCQDQAEEMDCRALRGPLGLLGSQATRMELWNASLDQSVIGALLEFQGSQDCWAKLVRKVRKERVALCVTQKDFVDPLDHRDHQEK